MKKSKKIEKNQKKSRHGRGAPPLTKCEMAFGHLVCSGSRIVVVLDIYITQLKESRTHTQQHDLHKFKSWHQ